MVMVLVLSVQLEPQRVACPASNPSAKTTKWPEADDQTRFDPSKHFSLRPGDGRARKPLILDGTRQYLYDLIFEDG